MTLLLDTSALVAALGSTTGASRYICAQGATHGWRLISSGYCVQETLRNLGKLKPGANAVWASLVEPNIEVVPDVLSMEQALVFPKAKDRPVVISALAAEADTLVTLDRTDCHGLLGPQIYGMAVRTPSEFLIEQRRAGLI